MEVGNTVEGAGVEILVSILVGSRIGSVVGKGVFVGLLVGNSVGISVGGGEGAVVGVSVDGLVGLRDKVRVGKGVVGEGVTMDTVVLQCGLLNLG